MLLDIFIEALDAELEGTSQRTRSYEPSSSSLYRPHTQRPTICPTRIGRTSTRRGFICRPVKEHSVRKPSDSFIGRCWP